MHREIGKNLLVEASNPVAASLSGLSVHDIYREIHVVY